MKPNQELCRLYGTKVAESPMFDAMVGLMGTGQLLADQHHSANEERRQQGLERLARQIEAERMRPTRQGLRPAGGIAPDSTDFKTLGSLQDLDPRIPMALGFDKGAEAVARQLVKEALGLGGIAGAAGGGVIRGVGAVMTGAGQAAQQVGQGLAQGFGATGRLARAAGPEMMAGLKPGLSNRMGGAVGAVGGALERGGAATQQTGHGIMNAALAPAPAAAKPLLSFGTKAKILGGAAALGAGYTAMKGLGAARDYMSTPAGNHGSGYLRSDVNQYGY